MTYQESALSNGSKRERWGCVGKKRDWKEVHWANVGFQKKNITQHKWVDIVAQYK